MGLDKAVHAFPRSISPKLYTIARLEFEWAYENVSVKYVSQYAAEDLLPDRYEQTLVDWWISMKRLINWLIFIDMNTIWKIDTMVWFDFFA